MLGVVQAFLSLASQQVELLLAEDLQINPANPLAVLAPACDDEGALLTVAESAGRDIGEIWPVVYGLDAFDEGFLAFGRPPDLLAGLCAILAVDTAWSPLLGDEQQLVATLQRELYQCRVAPDTIALLSVLQRLSSTTPMDALCDTLNVEPFLGYALGGIVRYCLRATGNQFADLSYDMVAQMERTGLDWRNEDVQLIGEHQRAAAELAEQYETLNARMLGDTGIVWAFLARVETAAASLGSQDRSTPVQHELPVDLAALQDLSDSVERFLTPAEPASAPCTSSAESGSGVGIVLAADGPLL